jgi:hypothetical protein
LRGALGNLLDKLFTGKQYNLIQVNLIRKALKGDISIIDEKREGYHLLGSLFIYLSFLI